MNTRTVSVISFLILVLLGSSHSLSDQYDQVVTDWHGIEEYIIDGFWYYQPYDPPSIGAAIVGRDDSYSYLDWESFRMKYRWNISAIPDNALITSATLYVKFRGSSNKPGAETINWEVREVESSDFWSSNVTGWVNITSGYRYAPATSLLESELTFHFDFSQGERILQQSSE